MQQGLVSSLLAATIRLGHLQAAGICRLRTAVSLAWPRAGSSQPRIQSSVKQSHDGPPHARETQPSSLLCSICLCRIARESPSKKLTCHEMARLCSQMFHVDRHLPLENFASLKLFGHAFQHWRIRRICCPCLRSSVSRKDA